MRNRFLADTPALLAFLTDPAALGGRAADVLERAQQGELSVIVPCGECFAVVEAAAWEYLGIAAVHLFGG